MSNLILFCLSLFVILILIWFDTDIKKQKSKRTKHLNYEISSINCSNQTFKRNETKKDQKLTEKLNQTILDISFKKEVDNLNQLKNSTETCRIFLNQSIETKINESKLIIIEKKEKKIKNEFIIKMNKKNRTLELNKIKRMILKSSFVLKKFFQFLKFILNLCLIFLSFLLRLLTIHQSIQNSFLNNLIMFYFLIFLILIILTICLMITLKLICPLFRLVYQIAHLHLFICQFVLNIVKTFLTFLIISIVLFYPNPTKHQTKNGQSNYFKHLKFISSGLSQTIIFYSVRLIGYSIQYLTKFENYLFYFVKYLEQYLEQSISIDNNF